MKHAVTRMVNGRVMLRELVWWAELVGKWLMGSASVSY